ncbi:hypothetical protein F4808DRAFT_392625 [Astrocystis sublimbata]|nr:hypothetical protein F4808DRAFT_392625 [Astrocystis sublimbata]
MADQDPTNKKKAALGGFPARFKSFVHDMKSFKKESYHRHRRGARSEIIWPKHPQPAGAQHLARTTEDLSATSETRSLYQSSARVRSLNIRVTVKFDEPLNYSHSQDYEASSSLQPTEELCEALIRRVDHCSKELITRKDSSALDRTGYDGLAKPLRYEIQLEVLRNESRTGAEVWASRTLRSYQKQPLGTDAAREVILSTHYMVGLFLRQHDEAFVWKNGPVRDDIVQEQKTFPYQPGRVQPLTSVPRSYFIEKQQEFEAIPGYTICLSFTSQNRNRTPSQWHETVQVNSTQSSPLTLASAENLFLEAGYAVDGVLRSQRKEFGTIRYSCATHSGCRHCRPHDGDGIEMLVSVKNNVGPQFDNLERTTSTSVSMFWKDKASDCIEFVEKAKTAIVQVCAEADEAISRISDFEFHIIELRGRGWSINEPLAFILGPESSLDRRSVESLLDRLQTGVADILRGNAIAVRMTARKRGHFVLHKTLVAREPVEKPGSKKAAGKSKAYVLDRLKQRIERDIEMVCKDTCTIVSPEVETPKPARDDSAPPEEHPSAQTDLLTSRRLSDLPTPSKLPASSERKPSPERLCSSDEVELHESSEPTSTSPVPQRPWSRVSWDPVTGRRLFPLVPDQQDSNESVSTGCRKSTPHLHEMGQDDAMETSFNLSTSREPSNTFSAQATSACSESSIELEATEVSLKGLPIDGREDGSTVSTRPRTPDLLSGGSASVRSSILVTPNLHELVLRNETDLVRKPTPEIYGDDQHGRVDNFISKLYMHRPTASPMSHQISRDGSVASVMSHAQPPHQDQDLNHPVDKDVSTAKSDNSSHSDAKLEEQTSPVQIMTEEDTPTQEEFRPALATEAEANAAVEEFSQSKPDFDFSSPLTATSVEDNNEAIVDMLLPEKGKATILSEKPKQEYEDADTASFDPFVDDESAVDSSHLARPDIIAVQGRHRKSFGSAGYLGSFQEQRFYGVGLRSALVGPASPSRPFSRPYLRDDEEEQQRRPGSSMM